MFFVLVYVIFVQFRANVTQRTFEIRGHGDIIIIIISSTTGAGPCRDFHACELEVRSDVSRKLRADHYSVRDNGIIEISLLHV